MVENRSGTMTDSPSCHLSVRSGIHLADLKQQVRLGAGDICLKGLTGDSGTQLWIDTFKDGGEADGARGSGMAVITLLITSEGFLCPKRQHQELQGLGIAEFWQIHYKKDINLLWTPTNT